MQADFLDRATDAAVPLRKAAMLLHSMSQPDRRWMLERVDAAQRARLEALLEELRALEFPIDAALVRESLGSEASASITPEVPTTDLPDWSVDEALEALRSEPDDLIALLLRAGDWPWAGELRTHLGAERLRAVDASRYSLASEVSSVLLDAAIRIAQSRVATLRERSAAPRRAKVPAMTRHAP